jgi:hypothetical protein
MRLGLASVEAGLAFFACVNGGIDSRSFNISAISAALRIVPPTKNATIERLVRKLWRFCQRHDVIGRQIHRPTSSGPLTEGRCLP